MLEDNGTVANTIINVSVHVQLVRGLIVREKGHTVGVHGAEPETRELVVKLVILTYRWNRDRWDFAKAVGSGFRRLPGGKTGNVAIQTEAIHPDYREMAQRYAPAWKPIVVDSRPVTP